MRTGKTSLLRHLLLCGWSVGMVLRGSGGVSCQEGATPPASFPKSASATQEIESFASLVEDLGSSQFAKRELAVDALRLGGQASLKALRQAQNHPDAEVRRRVSELLGPIEASIRLAPKRVSLERKTRTFRATLEAISKATGNTLEAWNNLEQQVEYGCENLSVLEVVDQLGRLTGTCLQQGYSDDRIRLGAGNCPPLVTYDGGFRLVATSLQQFRNIDLANSAPMPQGNQPPISAPVRNETLTLGMAIFSEPRLPLLGVNEPRLTEAWTEDGQSLLPTTNDPANNNGARRHVSRYGNGYRSQTQMANVALRRPANSSGNIKSISGVVSCLVLVEQKQMPITTELAKSKGKTVEIGTTSFTIDEVTGVGENAGKPVTVKLSVREKNNDNPGDYTWMNSLYQRLELTDADGNKFQNQGSNWGTSGPNFATITFTFGPPVPQQQMAKMNIRGLVLPGLPAAAAPKPAKPAGPPTKLVYTTWETMDHLVPFTFTDLPLP